MTKAITLVSAWVLAASCAASQPAPSPGELLKTEWLLEDLAGMGVLDRAQATLAFPDANKVEGNASCNRFSGTVEFSGDSIKFGSLATTQMACRAAALNHQESNYLRALEKADRFALEGPYLFIHSAAFDKPLRFTRLTRRAKP